MKVSQRRLSKVLGISERALRKRNGSTLPKPYKGQYELGEVLWYLSLDERGRVAEEFELDFAYMKTVFLCSIHLKGEA